MKTIQKNKLSSVPKAIKVRIQEFSDLKNRTFSYRVQASTDTGLEVSKEFGSLHDAKKWAESLTKINPKKFLSNYN